MSRKFPKVTAADHANADRAFQKVVAHEEAKDRDHKRELKDACADEAHFLHKKFVKGAVTLTAGYGPGKRVICQYPGCLVHDSKMFNMKDNKWYCGEHKEYGDLTATEKRRFYVSEQKRFAGKVKV